jgi:hypothetical protein
MANDLLYKASLHLGASPQNKRSSLLYKIQTVRNIQQFTKYRQAHVGVKVRRVEQCGKVMIRLEVLDSNSIGDRAVHAGADRLGT